MSTVTYKLGFDARFLRLPSVRLDAACYAVLGLVLVLVLAPLTFLVVGSFSAAKLPGDIFGADFGFQNYRQVWSDPALPGIFLNTLTYAIGATAIGVSFAAGLAWLVERTDLRRKAWIYAMVPLTLAIPGLLQAMAWVLLLSPKIGFINQLLQQYLGLEASPFNVYSLPAMMLIEGLRLVPTAFLMLVPLLRGMDSMLEEAAATCGANGLSTIRKVTLRLMLPGLAAVTIFQFITAIEAFEVPGVIGIPSGILVFSTKIYLLLQQTAALPGYGQANAMAMLYLAVALAGAYVYGRAIRHSERYSVITGKSYRPKPYCLGRLHYLANAAAWLYILLSVGLPILVLGYVSLLPTLVRPSTDAISLFTLANYRALLETDSIARVIGNTVVMSVVAATATAAISFCISLVIVRSRFWARRLLDQLSFLPSSIPGIVLALAFLWVFLRVDHVLPGLFGSIWSISIAFTAAFIAYGTRTMNAALLQIHRDLEEAGYANGAAHWRIMVRIFFPLVTPALASVWIWSLLNAARITGLPILLYEGTKNQVVAVLMWNMWQQGHLNAVAATGTMLTLFLLGISLGLRLLGFGRGFAQG